VTGVLEQAYFHNNIKKCCMVPYNQCGKTAT